jgi:RHS repeat-associated protein
MTLNNFLHINVDSLHIKISSFDFCNFNFAYYNTNNVTLTIIASTSECLGFVISPTIENYNLNSIEELQNSNNPENEMFFYHTDHLGSSSWITDASGAVNQHLQYLPLRQAQGSAFGEDYIYQRNSSWAVPYTFSGKEKDSETGYSYFGARYYDSDLSIWLSVDPMSDKLPFITPYSYCYNHPINYKDPDGKLPLWLSGAIGGVIAVTISYTYTKVFTDNEWDWKSDGVSSFAGGFMIGSGTALITGMGYNAARAIGMEMINGALGAGMESTTKGIINNDFSLLETSSDILIGLVTGFGGGVADYGIKEFMKKYGDKTIGDLSKKQLNEYLNIQENYWKDQLENMGLKKGGKKFKQELNRLMSESKDLKLSEIEAVRGGVVVTANKSVDVTLESIEEVVDENIGQ